MSRARPTPKDPNPLLQGNNRDFSPIPPFSAKNCPENNCESSSLPDDPPEIPCATEQGINSTTTGNEFATIRELIRRNRESGSQSPDASGSRRMETPPRAPGYGSTPAGRGRLLRDARRGVYGDTCIFYRIWKPRRPSRGRSLRCPFDERPDRGATRRRSLIGKYACVAVNPARRAVVPRRSNCGVCHILHAGTAPMWGLYEETAREIRHLRYASQFCTARAE